ncbi:hypothetical protein LJC63_06525 [Ruminococcaceae bacterium OttesenSCG-928-L11]|nr:hypothetical protein [Ruminococcaceae bacterium OttesenSCG-928-L11]
MKSLPAKVSIGIFLALLFGLSIVNLATPSRTFSENENRYLKEMPVFSLHNLFRGGFTSDFDEYVIDQFAFRDSWVGVKTTAEQALQKHASNGVYFADGSLIEMFDFIDRDRYEKNLGFVQEFSRRIVQEHNVRVNTMLIPTASGVLTDRLPAFAPEVDQRQLLTQAAETIPGFVDISDALLRHNSEYIYYKTDHHWTSLGAYYCYNEFRAKQSLPERSIEEYSISVLSDSFYGTTWSKASLYSVGPDSINAFMPKAVSASGKLHVDYNNGESTADTIYDDSYLDVKDKYSVFLNANQSVTKIETGVDNGRNLLLIKDSYANTFVQFLLSDYETITVIDPRFYRSSFVDYVGENGITDVLVLYNLKGFSSDGNVYFLTT